MEAIKIDQPYRFEHTGEISCSGCVLNRPEISASVCHIHNDTLEVNCGSDKGILVRNERRGVAPHVQQIMEILNT